MEFVGRDYNKFNKIRILSVPSRICDDKWCHGYVLFVSYLLEMPLIFHRSKKGKFSNLIVDCWRNSQRLLSLERDSIIVHIQPEK